MKLMGSTGVYDKLRETHRVLVGNPAASQYSAVRDPGGPCHPQHLEVSESSICLQDVMSYWSAAFSTFSNFAAHVGNPCNLLQPQQLSASLIWISMASASQVEFSLCHTLPENSGLLAACAELGVSLVSYSPLAQGRLTGKYSARNPPKVERPVHN